MTGSVGKQGLERSKVWLYIKREERKQQRERQAEHTADDRR